MDFIKAYKRIEEVLEKDNGMKDLLELYKNILEFQKTSIKRVKFSIPTIGQRQTYPIKKIIEEISEEELSNLFNDFLRFASLFGTEEIKKIAVGAVESKLFTPSLIKDLFVNMKEEDIPGVPPAFVHMAIFSTAPALSINIKEQFSSAGDIKEDLTCCPLCGRKAQVCFLKKSEEGKRYLVCSFCYTEWPIKRDLCPNCETAEFEEHFYFFPENEKHVKVDICENCNHYIKTVDERILDEMGETCCPLVDEIATPHIDIKLSEKGYIKVQKNIFSI